MWQYKQTNELYHYGVPGMKWGKRMVRGHGGPSVHLSRKRQLAADKRDLEGLNNGQHLSFGLTKKRQAAYDARDRALLEKRIAKNEALLGKQQKTTAKEKKTIKPETSANGKKVATTVLSAIGTVALSTAATLGTLYGVGRWLFRDID